MTPLTCTVLVDHRLSLAQIDMLANEWADSQDAPRGTVTSVYYRPIHRNYRVGLACEPPEQDHGDYDE